MCRVSFVKLLGILLLKQMSSQLTLQQAFIHLHLRQLLNVLLKIKLIQHLDLRLLKNDTICTRIRQSKCFEMNLSNWRQKNKSRKYTVNYSSRSSFLYHRTSGRPRTTYTVSSSACIVQSMQTWQVNFGEYMIVLGQN